MRGVAYDRFGGPEVLQVRDDLPEPPVGPDTVLVRTHAAGVNPVDLTITEGCVFVHPVGVGLGEFASIAGAGHLRVPIARAFPLEETAEAHRVLAEGHVRGKLVVTLR